MRGAVATTSKIAATTTTKLTTIRRVIGSNVEGVGKYFTFVLVRRHSIFNSRIYQEPGKSY